MSKPAARAAEDDRPLRARAGSEQPAEELAARLLSSAEAYRASSSERRRVWQELESDGTARHGAARRRLLSPVVVAALLLSLMTVASATVGRRLIERALHLGASPSVTKGATSHEARRGAATATTPGQPTASVAPPPPTLALVEATPERATAPGPSGARVAERTAQAAARAAIAPQPVRAPEAARTPEFEAAPAVAAPAADPPAPSAPTPPPAPPQASVPRPATPAATAAITEEDDAPGVRPSPVRGRLPEPSAALREAARSNPEMRLVYEASLATRQGDPARGLPLVEEYLRRFPDGVYAEFVLLHGIDAANRMNDVDATARLGARYLRQFPAGRFREEARRAVARTAPAP